jgi:hypothetical protein
MALDKPVVPAYIVTMSTVLEIEKAIEQLPTPQMLEVAEWLDTQRGMIAASETLFQTLDDAEGEEAGSQWLG